MHVSEFSETCHWLLGQNESEHRSSADIHVSWLLPVTVTSSLSGL